MKNKSKLPIVPKISAEKAVEMPTASWLKSDYNADTWEVVDSYELSPKKSKKIRFKMVVHDSTREGEICYLTDLKYKNILEIVKAQIFELRSGKVGNVTSAETHKGLANDVITFAIWLIFKNISCFSKLTSIDFENFKENATYGPGHLLQYHSLIKKQIDKMRLYKEPIPYIKMSNAKPIMRVAKIHALAGIESTKATQYKQTSYELLKLAQEEGFYLTPAERKRFTAGPPEAKEQIGFKRITHMLEAWQWQWRMRKILSEERCIQFDPFSETSPRDMALSLGKQGTRTPTPPAHQTMLLINYSLKWVLDYSPILFKLRDKFDEIVANNYKPGLRLKEMQKVIEEIDMPPDPGGISSLSSGTKQTQQGLSFGTAVKYFLPAACFIVICAFTARRHNEVLSVRVESSDNRDAITENADGFLLDTYIEKTLRDWDRVPCNEAVVAAIDVLRLFSEPARKANNSVSLFQCKDLINSRVMPFVADSAIHDFVEYLSLPLTKDGVQWRYAPHQFRRFFAILYFYRYEYANLSALSYQLRHFNVEMTHIYITEVETGAIFKEEGKKFTSTILSEAALGKRNISGPFGERFKEKFDRLIQQYRRQLKVVTPDLVNITVERLIEKQNYSLKGFRWGYCACGTAPNRLATARCLSDKPQRETAAEPDLSESSPLICGDCPHHLVTEIFKDSWQQEKEMHEKVAQDERNGIILREASRERTKTLERQFNRSFVNSHPLEELDEENG